MFPPGIPVISALKHTAALVELHPDQKPAHQKICKWMKAQLGKRPGQLIEPRSRATQFDNDSHRRRTTKHVGVFDPKKNPQLGFTVRTIGVVREAKAKENRLLRDYRNWLHKQRRKLRAFSCGRLWCDGYEEERRNLIEAKSSIRREQIRMAVGQLLDYSFQARTRFRKIHMAVLLPEKPIPEIENWLENLRIHIIWQKGTIFSDNANGWFTRKLPGTVGPR
jgi:hypothetical protein